MTYLPPLIGGLLIGISAMVLLLANGRVAGISGVTWGALAERPLALWRWLFLGGIVLGALAYHRVSGMPLPEPAPASMLFTGLAGLIVGFGVHLGSGCTSGHGVCGLGRLSMRSLVATLLFMSSGIATVFVLRHIIGVAS